jgi:hydrogenase maturation protein HypF
MIRDLPARPLVRRTYRVTGQVQGVGFRPFIYRLASDLFLSGTVRNDPTGVTIDVVGDGGEVDRFAERIDSDAPALARIEAVTCVSESSSPGSCDGFRIIESDRAPAERGRVTVDSAVCDDCLREMRDPDDRRHRHPLVNCTNCGPRYTIVRDLPYDRPLTTMADFPMCEACAEEYADPADRRFHAQPVCCPACGPRLRLIACGEKRVEGDPIRDSATLLRTGGILAMKGLGGYHLVVDAMNEQAVRRLRERKKRDHKPFALMARDLDAARALVALSDEAVELMDSPTAPIVLAERRPNDDADGGSIAPSVAPGSHRLGLMMPYTPMQHLLFDEGLGPLVMTSANLSDDPLIKDDQDALAMLGGIADAVLLHDRPIERAVDDSIVIDGPRGILPIRRARGYVPAPLTIPIAASRPGLCVGGELKIVIALVRGDQVILSQHIGDLTYTLAYRRFEKTIEDLQRLFDTDIEWVACDAHPLYLSKRFARRLAASREVPLIETQHHHAHLASLLAEHGRTDRAIGLICDGVGYGDDGTSWGGEILIGDLTSYERVGRLRPLRLPGGDAAARETGRCAMSWLVDALGKETLDHPIAERAMGDPAKRQAVGAMLERDLNCPPSSGMGRLFDAAASLLGVCDYNHHEAMSPMRLESLAARAVDHPVGDGLVAIVDPVDGPNAGALFEMDHRPLLHALIERIERSEAVEALAWLFHDALADALARAARLACRRSGLRTVALSGGVFCNTLLTDLVYERLAADGFEVLLHRVVPPNDGGIAYGQAAIAAARLAMNQS